MARASSFQQILPTLERAVEHVDMAEIGTNAVDIEYRVGTGVDTESHVSIGMLADNHECRHPEL